MKFLFLSTRKAKPSFRFRVEQFLPHFEQRGHVCDVGFLKGKPISRLWDYRRLPEYDLVFLQKRLLSGAELFFVRRRARRLVYDVDDAVMLDGRGETDARRQRRFEAVVRSADLVICGNEYLASQALRFRNDVEIIPTCINTEQFHPRLRKNSAGPITIGWTGSRSTNRYLNDILPALASLGENVQFRFLSDTPEGVDLELLGGVPSEFVRWSPDVEIPVTASFDIGLMPLPDDPWTRGKCGFKALQYMGLGIPAVCSPVGVNTEIITHQKNGLLATSREEWKDCLTRLARDAAYREELGHAGRQRVEERYAVNVQASRLIECLERVAEQLKHSA